MFFTSSRSVNFSTLGSSKEGKSLMSNGMLGLLGDTGCCKRVKASCNGT